MDGRIHPPHDFILNPGSFILNPNNLIVQQANYIDLGVDFNTEDWVPSQRQQQEINALLSDVTALMETQNHRAMARGLGYKFEVDMDYQAKYYAHSLGIEFRGRTVRCARAVHALCTRCAKSWLFSTTVCSVSSED